MNKHSLFLAFLLSVLFLAYVPSLNAYAQAVSIKTSADAHSGTFFGEGVLQVVVTNPDADDDAAVEDIIVDVNADPDTGAGGSVSVTVPETSQSSGKFEFFLGHEDAALVSPSDLDPINSVGVEGDGACITGCAPFVTFGPTGDLVVDSDLYEDTKFDMTVGDTQITIDYEEALASLTLDRSSYGSNSFVYVFVTDQDANLNPFKADEFIVDPDSPANEDLFSLNGGILSDVVTFKETGDNTAQFEGRYRLGTSISVSSESMVLTLSEKANYNATLSAAENDSGATDEVSFSIGDSDPSIDIGGQQPVVTWDAELSSDKDSYSFGEEIKVKISDPDANMNSGEADSLELDIISGDATAKISALETGASTGEFEASLLLGNDGIIAGTNLQVESGGELEVSYADKRPADYSEKISKGEDPEKDFVLDINVATELNDSTDVTNPSVKKIGGDAGSQLLLSTTVENNIDDPQPFVAIIEVRDSGGITVYLAWQTGTLDPEGQAEVGLSWTPQQPGDYEIRSFVISDLEKGVVLSEVASSETMVS